MGACALKIKQDQRDDLDKEVLKLRVDKTERSGLMVIVGCGYDQGCSGSCMGDPPGRCAPVPLVGSADFKP